MASKQPTKPSDVLTQSLDHLRSQGVPFIAIADLRPWKDNPRLNKAAVPTVVGLMNRFGWTNPVLYRSADMMLEAGHTRVMAAEWLGLTHIPAIRLEHSREDAEQYALADNRSNELAPWKEDALADMLARMDEEDRRTLGFDDDYFESLLERVGDEGDMPSEDEGGGDWVKFNRPPPGMVPFRFADYRGHVSKAVYDVFRAEYERRKLDGGEVMLDDVLRAWLGLGVTKGKAR